MLVAVVQVIDDADIRDSLGVELMDNRNLVLRLAEPSAVVVKGHCAAEFAGFLGDGPDALCFGLDAGALFGSVLGWIAAARNPNLWLKAMALDYVQNELCLIVEHAWKPPGQQADVMPLER